MSLENARPLALEPRQPRRGAVVVIPFAEATPGTSPMAAGLTDDIITRLAKLRVLFVIARGTSYALHDRGVNAQEAARILNAEYVVSGVVRRHAERISVLVELAHTRSARIVWADELEGTLGETFSVLDSIVVRIVAGISDEVEREESKRARLLHPSSLDAWATRWKISCGRFAFCRMPSSSFVRAPRKSASIDARRP
jgi:TolB-like protein